MSDDLIEQLHRAIPPQPGSQANGLVWYAQDVPATYQGAYVMLQGLEEQRKFNDGDDPAVVATQNAEQALTAAEPKNAFAMRFRLDETTQHSQLDYAAGITGSSPPPDKAQLG